MEVVVLLGQRLTVIIVQSSEFLFVLALADAAVGFAAVALFLQLGALALVVLLQL
ncbi:hypothetical protein M770_07670 [Pseudomonas aeruginosa VRFPA03]|nr:hypothetical protein M770_07670 [Pseudomonas aeruginosa VRFPA03]